MTRDQIANYLGLTLETVSRQFNALKKEGIITLSGRKSISVVDMSSLHCATGDDAESDLNS
jgi:CRP/FNR family transcriptional regulator